MHILRSHFLCMFVRVCVSVSATETATAPPAGLQICALFCCVSFPMHVSIASSNELRGAVAASYTAAGAGVNLLLSPLMCVCVCVRACACFCGALLLLLTLRHSHISAAAAAAAIRIAFLLRFSLL